MVTQVYNAIVENIDIAKRAITYFMAYEVEPKTFEEIKSIGIMRARSTNDMNAERYIKMGYLSLTDFMFYVNEKDRNDIGPRIGIIDELIQCLVLEKALKVASETSGFLLNVRYSPSKQYAKFLYESDLVLNIVLGWRYIITRYSDSVVKIEHKSKTGDISIGTGFHFIFENEDNHTSLIVTNKHVLENASDIKVITESNETISYSEIILDSKRDLGYIKLLSRQNASNFWLNKGGEILSEIITIGYPSVPMTQHSYQVCHKGEVNSFVKDYGGNNLFLFSAKTSSGNSGSPIIDKYGMVVGIVTEELFEKNEFYSKGKLPYYAAIPADEIIKSLREYVFK